MWRFMFVTFAFLGTAFYFLSGGADYAPAANSIQAQAQKPGATLFIWPDPASDPAQTRVAHAPDDTTTPDASIGADENTVSRAAASLSDLSIAPRAEPGAVRVRLAAADAAGDDIAEAVARDVANASPIGDVRKVTGSTVNMRSGPGTKFSRVARLSGDTRVAVLRDPGDGWLKIRVVETGRVGWMADWLVTASAN